MKLKWGLWFYGLGQATIGGAAAAGISYLSTLAGNQVTDKIPVMHLQTLGSVLIGSTLTNLFFYLKQSPLPAEATGNTDIINKPTETKP